MRRFFGKTEAVFDILYLAAALILAAVLLCARGESAVKPLAGAMALILVFGDSFHLIPRIMSIITGQADRYAAAAGRGKQIASVTMTLFYVLLWHLGRTLFPTPWASALTGVVIGLAALRVILCLPRQNEWASASPPVLWGVLRNIPFLLLGLVVAAAYFRGGAAVPELSLMWLAVLLSFAFYLPVVLWSNRHRMLGMLMLPKACVYLWIIFMFTSL